MRGSFAARLRVRLGEPPCPVSFRGRKGPAHSRCDRRAASYDANLVALPHEQLRQLFLCERRCADAAVRRRRDENARETVRTLFRAVSCVN